MESNTTNRAAGLFTAATSTSSLLFILVVCVLFEATSPPVWMGIAAAVRSTPASIAWSNRLVFIINAPIVFVWFTSSFRVSVACNAIWLLNSNAIVLNAPISSAVCASYAITTPGSPPPPLTS
jgi:hypothetical protein